MACRTLSSMLPVTSPPSMWAIVLLRYAAAIAIASCSNRSPQMTTMSGSAAWKPLVNSSAVRQAVFAIATWLPPSITLKSDVEIVKPPASMSSAMCRLYLSSRIDPPSISSSSTPGCSCSFFSSSWLRP